MAPLSPTVARWELMLRIKRRRTEFDVSASVIAKELGFTLSYWSKVEKERILAEDKLRKLMSLLEFDPDERAEMLRLREIAKRRGWWSEYAGMLSEEVMRLYGLEHGAQSIRSYTSILIPGLLQTEDYARAVIANDRARIRQVEIDRWVEVRMRRQRRLTESEPLRVTAIVNEAALTQRTGGTTILKDQLRHLLSVTETHADTVDVRVIPFDAPGGVLLTGASFHLLGFERALLPDVAWTETLVHLGVIEESEPVRHLGTMFATTLTEHALPRNESITLIERRLAAL
ncbi:helix-turn-helix domain-containing protein [Nocardia gipuzkoensis]|uniref:helix-turn-helix domain-containing protein n=1 Tax=Nocardia gipuzkoensis TaxID=2749991 RepID=UPI001E29F446|nr:helix-turn-helix transcriptional regulator [Nocardia gipuzkoensis]UGT70331.1 helix-turn-helix domain-containing protein [Nocardia gipuzkoensis]